jgi:hypothetical protein
LKGTGYLDLIALLILVSGGPEQNTTSITLLKLWKYRTHHPNIVLFLKQLLREGLTITFLGGLKPSLPDCIILMAINKYIEILFPNEMKHILLNIRKTNYIFGLNCIR